MKPEEIVKTMRAALAGDVAAQNKLNDMVNRSWPRTPWHRRRYGGTPLWQWLVLAAMILAMEAYLCR